MTHHLPFGLVNGLIFLLLISMLRMLLIGPTPPVFCSSGLLFFFWSLHWPVGGADLGEVWAGERWSLEKAHPRYLRSGRPISVPVVPFGRRSRRFIGALFRSLSALSGGIGRFVPCSIGAVDWESAWAFASGQQPGCHLQAYLGCWWWSSSRFYGGMSFCGCCRRLLFCPAG